MAVSLKSWGMNAPVNVQIIDNAAAGLQLNGYIFVADDYYEVAEIRINYRVAGGAAAVLDIVKCASGTVTTSGVALGLTSFDLTATAATPQRRGSAAGTLSATKANLLLAPGDSLATKWGGTLTGLLGVGGVVVLKRYRKTRVR